MCISIGRLDGRRVSTKLTFNCFFLRWLLLLVCVCVVCTINESDRFLAWNTRTHDSSNGSDAKRVFPSQKRCGHVNGKCDKEIITFHLNGVAMHHTVGVAASNVEETKISSFAKLLFINTTRECAVYVRGTNNNSVLVWKVSTGGRVPNDEIRPSIDSHFACDFHWSDRTIEKIDEKFGIFLVEVYQPILFVATECTFENVIFEANYSVIRF